MRSVLLARGNTKFGQATCQMEAADA